jgi:hypothetical protein
MGSIWITPLLKILAVVYWVFMDLYQRGNLLMFHKLCSLPFLFLVSMSTCSPPPDLHYLTSIAWDAVTKADLLLCNTFTDLEYFYAAFI